AGAWRQFRHVTLPMLGPTFLFVGIVTAIGYLQLFPEPYVMTYGGPLNRTLSAVMLMYQEGFRWWRMGYAAAVAFLLCLVIAAATALQMRFQGGQERRWNGASRTSLSPSGRLTGGAIPLSPFLGFSRPPFRATGGPPPSPPHLVPHAATLDQYRQLFVRLNLGRAFLSSATIAVVTTLVSLLFNSM